MPDELRDDIGAYTFIDEHLKVARAHGCALLSNGTAKCWGADTYGQLGINSTSSHSTPVTVSGLAGATSISAGGNHTAATLATGSLRAWGLNTSGQVGDGTTTNRLTPRGVSGF